MMHSAIFCDLLSELAEVWKERDALKEDAARWRYVRDCPEAVTTDGPDLILWSDDEGCSVRGDEAVRAVDEAMKKTVA